LILTYVNSQAIKEADKKMLVFTVSVSIRLLGLVFIANTVTKK